MSWNGIDAAARSTVWYNRARLAAFIRSIDLLKPVERCLAAGGTNVALADANYVLPESEIYARPRHAPRAEAKQR